MRKLLVVAVAFSLQACAHRTMVITGPGAANRFDVDAVLKANPMRPGEEVKPVKLGADEHASFGIVQMRTREKPHLHATHDLVVNLIRGEGMLLMIRQVSATTWLCSYVPMRAGDSSFIARGVTHCFVNRSSAPSVAFATYLPPFDGTDVAPSMVGEVAEIERLITEMDSVWIVRRFDACVYRGEGRLIIDEGAMEVEDLGTGSKPKTPATAP